MWGWLEQGSLGICPMQHGLVCSLFTAQHTSALGCRPDVHPPYTAGSFLQASAQYFSLSDLDLACARWFFLVGGQRSTVQL